MINRYNIRDPQQSQYQTGTIGKPICQCGQNLILEWIGNNIHYSMWDELTYPVLKFKGAAVEVWEWMNDIHPTIY